MPGNILFVCLPEPGHILPTIPIAQRLRTLGHKIIYLSSSEFRSRLFACGFQVVSFSDVGLDVSDRHPLYWTDLTGAEQFHCVLESEPRALKQLIEHWIKEIASYRHLTAIVADHLFQTVYHVDFSSSGCGAPVILIWTSLPGWKTNRTIPETPALNMALCPEDFELPQYRRPRTQLRYVEPSIDVNRREVDFDLQDVDPSKPLVLCSFGTQVRRHPDVIDRINVLVRAAKNLPAIQFVIATGRIADRTSIESDIPPPANARLELLVPQIKLLQRSDLLITHGGLGTIKEALYFGVPMLVIPFGYDQPENAARIAHFGLGSALLSHEVSATAICSKVESTLDSAVVRENVLSFKDIFRKKMECPESALLIDAIAERGEVGVS